jgi:hypothetical protein
LIVLTRIDFAANLEFDKTEIWKLNPQYSLESVMKGYLNKWEVLFSNLSTLTVTNYLFDLLERHSLFQAAEHLALAVLNQTSCTIATDLANKVETYRVMKKGNIAPDLVFDGEILDPVYVEGEIPKSFPS